MPASACKQSISNLAESTLYLKQTEFATSEVVQILPETHCTKFLALNSRIQTKDEFPLISAFA